MAFSLSVLEPIHLAALLVVMIVFIGAMKSVLLGVGFLVISLFAPPDTKLVFDIWHLVFLGVFLAWGVRLFLGPKSLPRGLWMFGLFLPLLAVIVFAMIFPGTPFRFKEQFVFWAEIPLTYLIVLNSLKDSRSLRLALWIMMGTVLAYSLVYIAFIAFLYPFNILDPGTLHFFHRHTVVLQMGLFLLLWQGLIASQARRRQLLQRCLVAPVVLAILLTGSRWGIISFIIAFAWFFSRGLKRQDWPKVRVVVLYFGVAALAVSLYMYFFTPRQFNFLFTLRWLTTRIRIDMLKAVITFFFLHPFIGIGVGYFRHYTYYSDTHNLINEILVSCGLIGIGAFSYLVWKLVGHWRRLLAGCRQENNYLVYAGIAGFIFFFLRELFDYNLEDSLGIQLGFILACIDAAAAFKGSH